jgi:pimeloyl-ACP methyl ester carboxylesterase
VGGSGETVMLIHGFGGDGKLTWRKQIKPLLKECRLIVPDILWFGKSVSISKPSLSLQAGSMHLILDEQEVEKANVCGISYGGFMVFEMLRQQPARLNSMIIVDSPGPYYPDTTARRVARDLGVEETREVFVPRDHLELKRMINASFGKNRKWPRFIYKEIYGEYFKDHLDAKSALLNELSDNRERYQDIGGIKFPPSLVIWGASDRVFPLWSGEALAENLKGEIAIIEKAGHLPNFEQSKRFNTALLEFLGDTR